MSTKASGRAVGDVDAGWKVLYRTGGSRVFGRVTAWAGILANVFMLGSLLILVVAPAAGPVLLAVPPSVSAIFRVLWYVLSAITLLRMSRQS